MTESLARNLLKHAERDEHPPITAWETCQLLRFWLRHHERHGFRLHHYARLDDLPPVSFASIGYSA